MGIYVVLKNFATVFFVICSFGLDFEHTALCVGLCQCIWLNKLDSSRKCQPMDAKSAQYAGFGQGTSVLPGTTLDSYFNMVSYL